MSEAYFSHVLLVLAVILAAAKLCGALARRLGQPAVLGELLAGIVLGNLSLAGVAWFEPWKIDPTLNVFSELGIILVVFHVGVESTVRQMLGVGRSALLVGGLGVLASFLLGLAATTLVTPASGVYTHIFLGATLAATSVGITARVLKDLAKGDTPEARVILGAAVVDDVLSLVALAVVTGVIESANSGAPPPIAAIAWILVKAAIFLVGALALGVALSPALFSFAARLKTAGALLAAGLVLCFFTAWLSAAIGLAPIIGAFAAGLVLEDTHSREFVARGERNLDDLLDVLTSFLSPIFFVMVGARTDLAAFANLSVAGLAAALTAAAVLGKQATRLGTLGSSLDGSSIAFGMMPRGEVQLIFASIGAALMIHGRPVLDHGAFSAIVIVVMVTTLLTPPALKWSFGRRRRAPLQGTG